MCHGFLVCMRIREKTQNTVTLKEGLMPSEDDEILPISP